MNINELNRIRTINIEERLAGVAAGSGTFGEILTKVMDNEIIPIVANSGMIVGISYDSKVDNLLEDNIAQAAFEKRYSGKPVMQYVLHALQLKADNARIETVEEDEQGIRVILESGEVVVIADYGTAATDEEKLPRITLPEEIEIALEQFGSCDDVTEANVKAYLRDTYGHYLSGQHNAPNYCIESIDGRDVVKVTNIHWGRKR